MADTIKDLILNIEVELEDTEIPAPSTVEFENWRDDTTTALDEVTQKNRESVAIIEEQNLRATESFRAAGDGAITFARGVAFAAASNEDDMQKMLQNVARVQAAYDLFKGSIEVVKGLSEAHKALAAASAASTAAQSSGAAAAASLSSKLGVVGIVVAGLIAIWAVFRSKGTEAIEEVDEAAKEHNKTLREGITITEAFSKASTRLGDPKGIFAQRKAIEDIKDGLAGQVRTVERLNALNKERETLETNIGRVITETLFRGQKERFEVAKRLNDAKSNLQYLTQIGEAGANPTIQQDVTLNQQLLTVIDQIQDVENERLRVTQQRVDLDKQSLEASRERVKNALDELDALKQQVSTANEAIGRLSESEREELKSLANRQQQGGVLSREELQRLEQLAGAVDGIKEFVGSQFEAAGAQTGIADLLSEAFNGEKLTERVNTAEQAFRELQQTEEQFQQTLISQIQNRKDGLEKILVVLERSVEVEAQVQQRLQRIEAAQLKISKQNGR